ncbi:DegT/DnrJ/EryC1/StrS family aminotransferase [Thermodesulfobacteriota bacterium]
MKVPLLDLKKQYQSIKAEILRVTEEVYDSQYFILGPRVESLEKEISDYCATGYAVGVSSGTDALLIALMAADIGPADYVVTTPYTFFATVGSIVRLGARPVFVDIDPDTYNISPSAVAAALENMPAEQRRKVKALIPVHLYGQCADMAPLLEIADEHRLVVIEDAAQAIGATYKDNQAGSLGDFGCFSFFPSKNLGAFGDGGVVTTNSEKFYERLKILRVHGSAPKYLHKIVGGNFRLDALQAAIVSVKLKYLDQWTAARRQNAERYRRLFADAGLTDRIILPQEKVSGHIYNQFVIQVDSRRDALWQCLQEAEIGTEIYYPVPMHLQECFAFLKHVDGDFPVTERAANHTLALPIFPELTDDQQAYVVEKIKAFYA